MDSVLGQKQEVKTKFRGISIKLCKDGRHLVSVGKKFTGKESIRRFFTKKVNAEAYIQEITKKHDGELDSALSLGVSTLELAEIRVALDRLKATSTPLREVVDFWFERRTGITPPSVGAAIDALLRLKAAEGTGARHQKDTREKLNFYFKGRMDQSIASFDRDEILDILAMKDGLGMNPSPSQKAKRRRYLNILFNDAVSRKWVKENPIAGIKAPRKVAQEKVIFTPKQVAALLWHTQKLKPKMLPLLAIKCFSGVRNEEIFKIPWRDVGESIIVQASYSKTGRRRSATIFPVLRTWLDICERGNDDELIFSSRPERRDRPAAWYQEMKPIAEKAGLSPWPQNALRHLFGSYHLEWKKEDGLTAYEMGNSVSVVKSTYTDAVKPGPCRAFWELVPLEADFIVTGMRSSLMETDEPPPEE